jgi:hypothetical protein
MVVDNGVLYMRLPTALTSKLPGVKPWLKLDLRHAGGSTAGLSSLIGSSRQLTDPGQYFQYLHSMAAGSLQNLGAATINGVQTTHYHGEINAAQLSQAAMSAKQPAIAQAEEQLSKTIAGGRIPVDVYVDSSGLVRRIAIYEPLSLSGKSAYAAIKVDFPQYGAQPAPAVPPADQVTNLASLAGAVP